MADNKQKLETLREFARVTYETEHEESLCSKKITNLAKSIATNSKILETEIKPQNLTQIKPQVLEQKTRVQSAFANFEQLMSAEQPKVKPQQIESVEEETKENIKIESKQEKQSKVFVRGFVKNNNIKQQKPKNSKFKRNIAAASILTVVAISGVFIANNAVQIAKTNGQIALEEQLAKEYALNIPKYLLEIKQLEEVAKPDSTTLVPIEHIITLTPTPLEDKTEYEEKSNWFDYIINYISSIFGG